MAKDLVKVELSEKTNAILTRMTNLVDGENMEEMVKVVRDHKKTFPKKNLDTGT